MSKPLRVLVLTKYGRLGASSRLRFLQYIPALKHTGMQLTIKPLVSDEGLRMRYLRGHYALGSLLGAYLCRWRVMMNRGNFDLLWVEKEAFPWIPFWIERILSGGVPYVVDFDDADFHRYDQHSNSLVRKAFGQRLDRLMARANLVIVGNHYLAERARKSKARWVEILPTAIDLDRYPYQQKGPNEQTSKLKPPRIVWIGSPSTARYLAMLQEPLQELATRHSFVLRLIGCEAVNLPGVQIETLPWSEETEVADLGVCEIGVMPLLDTLWEQGKCGYKLIQYMACGLPVVASNIGANSDIVHHGQSGFLVQTAAEWVDALSTLLQHSSLRTSMGHCGRDRVERLYCIQKTGPRLAQWLHSFDPGQ